LELLADVNSGDKLSEIQQIRLACHLNLAFANLNLKRYSSAVEHADQALVIEPRNVKALFRRGEARLGSKDWSAAKDDFQAALTEDPSNTLAKKRLALCNKEIQAEKARNKNFLANVFK
jgi:Tfp pilus assembly protein PilF